jgi:hypothetical protein
MSVSTELLCSFELLKPLDSNALKNHIKKGRNKRNQMLNSPVCPIALPKTIRSNCANNAVARRPVSSERLSRSRRHEAVCSMYIASRPYPKRHTS